jgi:nucleotide-binding universal stress UspA family protein
VKNILVPIHESDSFESMLHCALLVGEIFESHIEGFRIRQDSNAILAADDLGAASPALLENFDREETGRANHARTHFEHFMQRTAEQARSRISWNYVQANASETDIGSHGRLFDLIVVGRPSRSRTSAPMSVLEGALFETGRPILIAPPGAAPTIGNEVVIAWNGSTETARTIAFSMPFLRRAQRVVVLTVEGGAVLGPTGNEVAEKLARHGLACHAVNVPAGKRTVGEAILGEAAALGADLLVKGGYTQSRLRQMIFGGATSHILAEAQIPVIMAH